MRVTLTIFIFIIIRCYFLLSLAAVKVLSIFRMRSLLSLPFILLSASTASTAMPDAATEPLKNIGTAATANVSRQAGAEDRDAKQFGIFNVVTFPNDACG